MDVLLIKPRAKSQLLIVMEVLHGRMQLPEQEKQYYLVLKKGYEGERLNDLWIEKLVEERLVLHNLLYEVNNSQFQIDTLMLTQDTLYVFDVKNYEGDYSYKDNGFYNSSGKEVKNPLHQSKRCETLLRQMLQTLGFNIPIESYLIFINPGFHLYHAPADKTIVYPTQLKRFYQNLNTKSSKLHERHKKLAQKLLSENIQESIYSKLPSYEYVQLQKGISCCSCQSLRTSLVKKQVLCHDCGFTEAFEAAVMRSIGEFRMLFPERQVTTNRVWEWCGGIGSKKVIRVVLRGNYRFVEKGKYSYYE